MIGSGATEKIATDSDPLKIAVELADGIDTVFPTPVILYVGVEGDVKVDTYAGNNVTYSNVQGFVPILVTKVYSDGTTATSLVAHEQTDAIEAIYSWDYFAADGLNPTAWSAMDTTWGELES